MLQKLTPALTALSASCILLCPELPLKGCSSTSSRWNEFPFAGMLLTGLNCNPFTCTIQSQSGFFTTSRPPQSLKMFGGFQVTGEEGRRELNSAPSSLQEADHLLAQRLDCERPLTTHLQLVPLLCVGHKQLCSRWHASGQLCHGQVGPKCLKHLGSGLQCQGKVFDGLEGRTIITVWQD